MTGAMFLSLDSAGMAACIGGAQVSVCYAAPGIQQEPAEAKANLAKHLEPLESLPGGGLEQGIRRISGGRQSDLAHRPE